MAGIAHSFVEANGLSFHVATAGDPENPMILFLHGFPEFWYAWRHQLEDLSDRFFCVAPDTRGINRTERPDAVAAYDLSELVEDAAGLIVAFGKQKAVIVGHDWGGFAAWDVAIRRPDVVERLIVVNCAHPGIMSEELHVDGSAQQSRSQYMLAFRSDAGEMLVSRENFEGFRVNILEPQVAAGHLSERDVDAYMTAWNSEGSISAGLNYYRANKSGPPSGDDALLRPVGETRVSVPTLVLWGEQDPYFSLEGLERLPEAVEQVTLVRYPKNDHWIIHQIPDEISAQVRTFVGPGTG